MTRCARERRVFYVEEPTFHAGAEPHLVTETSGMVMIVVAQLPHALTPKECASAQRRLIDQFIHREGISDPVLWYYTPMALTFTDHLSSAAVVYDCMDELSMFKGAPASLKRHETELLRRAALVLTGGHSLYKAKRHQHSNIHAFPSSVDVAHFAKARETSVDPVDQAPIPHPRLGFFGVIDERMDLALIDGLAAACPGWQIVMAGPVVKIAPDSLPRRPNIHYLGSKHYHELPQYVAGWDVALMPFARNDATRFISPTKTPEYLAAGKPVVSTSIRDVVRPYEQLGLVRIADDVQGFVEACREAMCEDRGERMTRADAFLRRTSWDGTWAQIRKLLEDVLRADDIEYRRDSASATAV
jgi:UDP-galactopyranose mutase